MVSCSTSNPGGSKTPVNTPTPTSPPTSPTVVSWNNQGEISIGLTKYGSVTTATETGVAATQTKLSGSVIGDNNYYYVTGKNSDGAVLYQYLPFNSTQAYQKQVMLDNSSFPPSAYPYAFVLNNTRYLLFGYGLGTFKLYQYQSENNQNVYFVSSSLWDFSNVKTGINTVAYTSDGGPWVLCPTYNDTLHTLYFTLLWKVDGYVHVRLFESQLTDNVFGSPIQIPGPINPADASHYSDGQAHDQSYMWIGRMYLTKDGTKAFFNALNIVDQNLIKTGDPYSAPIPNNQQNPEGVPWGDPSIIFTYVLTADVVDGEFQNITPLQSVNTGGINYICGVSDDGGMLYTAHMDIGADFGVTTWPGWGADGVVLECCFKAPYEVDPWNGTLNIILNN
ncbi:MAG TPA: hypothetical protein VHY08_24405 [Bacillota bacterium]|nr:hypothetical protein [Bacillota bacterium]